jgi:hypothetical protein
MRLLVVGQKTKSFTIDSEQFRQIVAVATRTPSPIYLKRGTSSSIASLEIMLD